ncbi:MAG: histidinol-phosphate transaminase [Spirochaetales bacterium]|nr:histidinol-phosphate transaminase [Spirochaetales bacterium]
MKMSLPTLRLDANEGRCLLSETTLASLLTPETARRYPDRAKLGSALAAWLGLPAANVLATAGADDALDRTVRAVAQHSGSVMSTFPGFVEFLAAARRSTARFIPVRKDPFGPFDIDAITAAIRRKRPSLLVLASPDNPSGSVLTREETLQIAETCAAHGTLFLFDATYGAFSTTSASIAEALTMPSTLVMGSFSKVFGLAGFRIGWIAGSQHMQAMIAKLGEAGPPFSLSSPAIEAGLAALALDPALVRSYIEEIKAERTELAAVCRARGWRTAEGEGNFVLLGCTQPEDFQKALADRGILVRVWPGKEGYSQLVRITVPGDRESLRRVAEAIMPKEALA